MASQVLKAQQAMNRFVKRQRLGHAPLIEDGKRGRLTNARIRECKFDLGYIKKNRNVKVDENFIHRLNHPTRVEPKWGQTKSAVKRGRKRRIRRRARVAALHTRAILQPGVTYFDGKPVAKAAVPYLKYARSHGWGGVLVSGYRTPAYSESLCYRMCGRPSCPGRCAGRATNHAWALTNKFGIDVSDYIKFGQIMASMPAINGQKLHNYLPNDRVHFSPSGR